MEDYQSPSQVSLNTKRLSAMIDSLHEDQDDEELLNNTRESSSVTTPKKIQHPHRRTKSTQGSPSKLPRSPAGFNVSLNSPDKDYRTSMLSNYSGVVQEGVGVSYVMKNPHNVIKEESKPQLPNFPSTDTIQASSRKSTGTSDDIVLKKVGNVTTGRGFSNLSADDSRTSSEGPRQESLKLLSINSNKRSVQPTSSIGSGNMASESETSTKKTDLPDTPVRHGKGELLDRISTPKVDSDTDSIATSIIPEVTTTTNDHDKGMPPARSETTDYNPAIPPRSRNRPLSKYLLQEDGEVVQLEGEERDSSHSNLKAPELSTRRSSVTNASETYYSVSSSDAKNNRVDIDLTNEDDENEGSDTVNAYLSRPLPTVPQQAEVHRDSTIKREQGREPEVVTTLASSSVKNQDDEDSDDQYEYIDESGRVIEDSAPQSSPSNRRTKSIKKKKQQELRQFDVDTLSQLLNVTKGTLIGAEFANLGMKIEEKRALERLVDSLSRLTADMVLDPDRYEEGLKRLNKATKALEGF
ncbi:hypothetical protein ZYGM_004531 [Zygosaccharomyces mellis]|uniref:Uncharacterized protein n=1 Tax=Zygosaccharomyces mellis TaxID=42258 RepID=A0A4C2E1F5_9SACH|nr:hypothetical protein ZYGM_004531 [Zygosaccharomyces mellis]